LRVNVITTLIFTRNDDFPPRNITSNRTTTTHVCFCRLLLVSRIATVAHAYLQQCRKTSIFVIINKTNSNGELIFVFIRLTGHEPAITLKKDFAVYSKRPYVWFIILVRITRGNVISVCYHSNCNVNVKFGKKTRVINPPNTVMSNPITITIVTCGRMYVVCRP